jgi:hypothetical protein
MGQRWTELLFDHSRDARLHLRSHVPVAGADQAALAVPASACHMAHQLIDHPGRDAAVL